MYSLIVSTGFLTSLMMHRLSIPTTSHLIPWSHANFRPWYKLYNSAMVTEECPIFIPKPKIQAPLWSRITPPALDAPVRLQALSVFNLHHGQVRAIHAIHLSTLFYAVDFLCLGSNVMKHTQAINRGMHKLKLIGPELEMPDGHSKESRPLQIWSHNSITREV